MGNGTISTQMDGDAERARAVQAFEQFAECFPDAVALTDLAGNVLACNGAARAMLCASPGEDTGRLASLLELVDDHEHLLRFLKLAARTSSPFPGALRLRNAEGELRHLSCSARRVTTRAIASGTPDALLLLRCSEKIQADQRFTALNREIASLRREITARRSAEEATRKGKRRFQALFDAAPDATLLIDCEGTIVLANESLERELGRPSQSLVGAPVTSVLGPALGREDNVLDALLAPFDGAETAIPGRMAALHMDGSVVPVDVRLRRLEIDDRPVVVAALRNLTEQLRIERENRDLEHKMQQAQKLESLGVLAGGIAHDFNNLLLGMMGNADLVLREDVPDRARACADDIVKSAQRAAELCKQLLAYSGRGSFVVQPASLSAIVHEMAHLLEISISKKVELRRSFADGLPRIDVDETQIRQVIMNLIINASDAIGDAEGTIRIRTGRMRCDESMLRGATVFGDPEPGSYVFVEISDTGGGIEPDKLERIFEPFFTTKTTGRGLGLAAVLGIVRSHCGALKVESEPGEGTTFLVLLPESSAAAPVVRRDKRAEIEVRGGGRVLVVDDEAMVRSVAKRIFERHGFEVLLAENGRVALELLEAHRVSVVAVVLDMTMPVMNGEETLAELRKLDASLPVVLASGFNEQSAPVHIEQDPALRFVQKPYRIRDLMDALQSMLDGA